MLKRDVMSAEVTSAEDPLHWCFPRWHVLDASVLTPSVCRGSGMSAQAEAPLPLW